MDLRLILALALAAAPAGQAPLSLGDLQAAVARYQQPRADQFAPPPTQEDIIGRRFRVSTRFPQLIDAGGPRVGRIGGWAYDAGEGRLTLDPWIALVDGYEMTSDPSLHSIDSRFHGFVMRAQGRYVGQQTKGNAFGATVRVDEYRGRALIIASYAEGYKGSYVFPDQPDQPTPATVAMASVEARELTPHLVLIVEGEVQPYRGSRAIACGETGSIATFEHRSERTLEECVISARIDRYTIQDERNGRALAEWRSKTGS